MSTITVSAPSAHGAPSTPTSLTANLHAWSDAGLLRHLDSSFATFIATLDPAMSAEQQAALTVAAAMLSHLEGRGHSCLPLAALASANSNTNTNAGLFAWPTEHQPAVNALWATLPGTVADWLNLLRQCSVVQRIGSGPDPDADQGQPLVLDGPDTAPRLYLRRYWHYERTVTQAVLERCAINDTVDEKQALGWLDRLFPSAANTPTPAEKADTPAIDWQKLACAIALRGRLTVITGGPGTGKTYTAARLLALLLATSNDPQRLRIALAAPTGKAAARLKQSIDGSLQTLQTSVGAALDLVALTQRIGAARTLHSLLGARPDTRRFRYHAGNPLDVDVVIVDEASMVHLEMMAALLDALPATARLILLGDKDQLASVEAGAVLGDLCRTAAAGHYSAETARYLKATTSTVLPDQWRATQANPPTLAQQTVMLRKSERFGGLIGQLALAVNNATDPNLPGALLRGDKTNTLAAHIGSDTAKLIEVCVNGRPGTDASYRNYLEKLKKIPTDQSAEAHTQWVTDVIKAFDRFRVLCAVREGDWGVSGLNRAIEKALAQTGLLKPTGSWYTGRPVMVTHNDPALGVFNGDIGITLPAADPAARLRVYFLDGERLRSVAVSRLAHVETAFAMTVHKSQGSEFEHTLLALAAHSGSVLTRELLYTGITRSGKAFSLFEEKAGLLESGVLNATRRESGLMIT